MDANEDFDILEDREHAYEIQNMHIGSDKKRKRQEYVYDETGIHLSKVKTPEGIYRIFAESLANAGDNKPRSEQYGYKFGRIKVTVTSTSITIKNGGVPIPVEKHKKGDMLLPEMLISRFRTSSNYDKSKKRVGAGRNGFGLKEINVFSKLFIFKVGDADRGKQFIQVWKDNMKERGDPEVTKYTGKNYVELTYELDFERFGVQQYSEKDILHFKALAAELAFYYKIPIKFNGETISFENDEEYGRLYFTPTFEEHESEDPENPDIRDHILAFESGNTRIIVADTPNEGCILSMVNGLPTPDGGAHVNEVTKKVCEKFISEAKKEFIKQFKENSTKKTGAAINIKKVLPHLSFIIACKIDDPDWGGGQSKTKLNTFDEKITVPNDILKKMENWSFVRELNEVIDQKMSALLAKTDGKKNGNLGPDGNITPAGYAGKKRWREAILIIVEGKSASQYPKEMLRYIDGGRKVIGIFPVKGKVLNLRKASAERIIRNKEYALLKKHLGLREGVDYSKEEEFETLNYGRVMVLADGDPDGDHIRTLLYNNFYCRWPSLIKRGYLFIKRTPFIVASKGKEIESFYFPQDYEKFLQRPDIDKWNIEWYKGLATSTRNDVGRDMRDPKYAIISMNHEGKKLLDMAFDSKAADQRKDWLAEWKEQPPSKKDIVPMSIFINTEMIRFAFADLIRCIPGFVDGLKPGQRKIVWGIIKKFGYNPTKKIGVENLGNIVASETQYHYGPKSLTDTLMRMTQGFVGAANMPLLADDGLSGSRDEGGKDAGAPRYVKTKPMPYFQYIFRKEDEPILEILNEEGYDIEPRFMLPVVPLLAINGPIGIGYAYSCFFANYHPLHCIEWIKAKLRDKPTPTLIPWYNGFTGEITVINRKDKKPKRSENDEEAEEKEESEEIDEPTNVPEDEIPEGDEVLVTKNTSKIMVIKGVYKRDKRDETKIRITDLPVGVWTKTYRLFLNKLKESKNIKDFEDDCNGSDVINFTLKGIKKVGAKELGLVKIYSLSNMVALDTGYKPVKFDDIEHIMMAFFTFRLPFYQKRKDHILGQMKHEISVYKEKMKLLKLINDKTIKVVRRKEADIIADMKKHDINPDLIIGGKGLAVRELATDNIQAFEQKVEALKVEFNELNETSIETLWERDLDDLAKHLKKYLN